MISWYSLELLWGAFWTHIEIPHVTTPKHGCSKANIGWLFQASSNLVQNCLVVSWQTRAWLASTHVRTGSQAPALNYSSIRINILLAIVSTVNKEQTYWMNYKPLNNAAIIDRDEEQSNARGLLCSCDCKEARERTYYSKSCTSCWKSTRKEEAWETVQGDHDQRS